MSGTPTLVSTRFDLTWFVMPGVLAALIGAALGLWAPPREEGGLALWIVGVLLVDVAHVYASLYRTYLDPEARRIHRRRLVAAPLLCLWFCALAYLESPLLFWGLLAYVAIFHFIKQHEGFCSLYSRKAGESEFDRRFAKAALWAGTTGPVVWWHANLPRRFSWFIEGDLFTGLPAFVGSLALALAAVVLVAFVVRRGLLALRGSGSAFVSAMVLLPALNWHLGIVVFDDDRVFTVTNVVFHGVPYMALVWVSGGRERVRKALPRAAVWVVGLVFYGLLAALAFAEEALWDRVLWHEHPQLFGESELELTGLVAALVVGLLSVPQATHYLLDRWIWRVGPDNPRLAAQLGFAEAQPADAEALAEA